MGSCLFVVREGARVLVFMSSFRRDLFDASGGPLSLRLSASVLSSVRFFLPFYWALSVCCPLSWLGIIVVVVVVVRSPGCVLSFYIRRAATWAAGPPRTKNRESAEESKAAYALEFLSSVFYLLSTPRMTSLLFRMCYPSLVVKYQGTFVLIQVYCNRLSTRGGG